MKKNLFGKMAIVVVILAAFIGYNIYSKWDETHFSVDPEAFTIKNSYEEVLKVQNQQFPNLHLAREFDLPKKVNRSVLIPDQHRKIIVHEIWFKFPGVYLLYSINLHKEDQDEESVPKLQFSSMKINTSDGQSDNVSVKPVHSGKSIVCNGKLYRGVFLYPNYADMTFKHFHGLQDLISKMNRITLQEPVLISGKDNKIKIDDLSVSYDYNHEDYNLIDVPVNEKITLDTGATIKFSRFHARIQFNQLDFTIKSEKAHIRSLYFQSHQPDYNLEMHGVFGAYVNQQENGHYIAEFPAFSQVPESLTLKITDVGLSGKKAKFAIPARLDAKEKKIGEVLGTSFYFVGYKEEESSGKEGMVTLTLKWEIPYLADQKEGNRIVQLMPHLYWRYENNLKHANNEVERQQIKRQTDNLLAIKNEKGERPGFIRKYNTYKGEKYTFTKLILSESYVENAKHLTLHLSHLMYKHPIEPKTIEIQLPDVE
ncbi:MAG TPA: hypothetical protein VF199_13680 [Bacillales bacterium]